MAPLSIGILASGSGTNFDSIAAAVRCGRIPAHLALLICNRPEAGVLAKAAHQDVATQVIDHRGFSGREEFDGAVADALEAAGVELVVMAGFDRSVTSALLRRFPQRVVNIHPALLPAFRGSHAQNQTADYGVTIAGATVHFVDEDVDHGPIIMQGAVPVAPGESAAAVQQRILAVEHRIFPEALRLLAQGRVRVEGRFVHIQGRRPIGGECLVSPPLEDS